MVDITQGLLVYFLDLAEDLVLTPLLEHLDLLLKADLRQFVSGALQYGVAPNLENVFLHLTGRDLRD